jgi:uncharacterized Zn finger protein (UPF0148 family)
MESQDQPHLLGKTCVFCQERFWSKRSDARFCSASHRAKFYRWRKKLPTNIQKAQTQIREAAEYLDYDVSRAAAIEYFNSLTAMIRAEMEARGVRFVR